MYRRPLLFATLAVAVYAAAYHVPAVRAADARALHGFIGLSALPGADRAGELVALFNPASYALLVLGIAAAGAVSGRVRAGLVAAGTMVCASATTHVLKPLLAAPRDAPFIEEAAWPSGHTTAVMSFALALALVASPRLRPYATAVGAVLTVLTVFAIVLMGGHYPSDVAGGLLVASAWFSIAAHALRAEARPSLRGPALAGAALVALAGLAVATRPGAAVDYAVENTTFAAVAVAIAGAALALSGSVLAPTAARRRPRRG